MADRIGVILATLRAVDAGDVWHYPAGNGSTWPTDRINQDGRLALIQPSYRMTLIERDGLAVHEQRGTGGGRVPWMLTERGRAEVVAELETGRG